MQIKAMSDAISEVDESTKTIRFIASDETQDSYNEVIKASGWKHNHFQKNRPFLDSHNYGSILGALGRVVSWEVARKKLFNDVNFASDIPEHPGPRIAYALYRRGDLRAVSVGFKPIRFVSRYSADDNKANYEKELAKLTLPEGSTPPSRIYLEQEQIELSAVVIGANPNAVAQNSAHARMSSVIQLVLPAHRENELTDQDVLWLSTLNFATSNDTDTREHHAAAARLSSRRAFLNAFDKQIETLKKKSK